MTFRKKILRILYSFIGIACSFIVVVYGIVAGQTKTIETYNVLDQNSMVVSNSYDSIIETSNSAINLILSEPEVLNAIKSLSTGKTQGISSTEKYYSNEYKTIRGRINLYFVYKYCHRVVYFNEFEDVISSDSSLCHSLLNQEEFKEGELRLIPAHNIKGNKNNKTRVISVVKKIAGKNMGYFEVQWLESDVKKLLALSDDEFNVTIYDESGRKMFSNEDYRENIFQVVKEGKKHFRIGNTLYSSNYSKGYYTVVSAQLHIVRDIIIPILPALFGLLIVYWVITLLYANYGADSLVRPIVFLQKAISRTDYEKLSSDNLSFLERNELRKIIEIEKTYETYEKMVERLEESKKKAEKMSFLQLKAQLDLMQAQVNPHFIYNVLNIISAKGLMADDESICDMCDNLSKILRYSTNLKTKEATVYEEVEYLKDYLMLLKCRYETRLDYSISIGRDIWDEIIPKLVLQQMVENSVKHGFSDTVDILHIEIEGKETDKGWIITIKDNGCGIDSVNLDSINYRIFELRKQLDACDDNIEFEIGGMGIYNTYARLYLLYKSALTFDIKSGENGTTVIIEIE